MTVFVDTSALYAYVDGSDTLHRRAADAFRGLVGEGLVSHSYVVVESEALLRRRLGVDAARDLLVTVFPLMRTVWVDEDLHRAGVTALLAGGRRRISLVDCVSFELMRRERIDTAFAFDRHFAEQGFATIP